MDREIQNGIEDYLHRLNRKAAPGMAKTTPANSLVDPAAGFAQRLEHTDAETRQEVEEFRRTANLLHTLQTPPGEFEPAPGFYARVMERIEAERASNSFWSIFLNPQFSRRLVFASVTLLVLLGVTFATTDANEGWFGTAAPELVEVRSFEMPEDYAVSAAAQPIEAGLVSHNDAGHDEMLLQLATYQQ